MSAPAFEVLEGGLLTTIQDAGRPDWTHLGVPRSGAADPWSLAVANVLAGNDPGAAALELTIAGPRLRALRSLTIALAGADLGGRTGTRRLLPGRTHRLDAGDVVELPGGSGSGGCRAILAVSGGFDVPEVLGSRSTCLAAAFGGLDGRALRAGDTLAAGPAAVLSGPDRIWPQRDAATERGATGTALRVLPAPAGGIEALLGVTWRVAPASDRVGTRLEGTALPDGVGAETTTHGVPWGAIQVPPDGRPIVLGPDHQTTGGYRVVGVVCSADLPILAQLGPGAELRLVLSSSDDALAALRSQADALRDGAIALREGANWDTLVHGAGG